MRLLVFSALMSVCRCFYPPLETMNDRDEQMPTYIFNKDEYLRQIGANAQLSYANPFLQYQQPYIPINYLYSQYNNAISPYDSLLRQQSPSLNDISISNYDNDFLQNFPTVLTNQRMVPKDSTPSLYVGNENFNDFIEPEKPIILTDTPQVPDKDIRYLKPVLSMNKKTPYVRTIEHPGVYFDLIHQRRKSPMISDNLKSPMVAAARQNVPHDYGNLDINNYNINKGGQWRPNISLNKGDGLVTNSPDVRNIIRSIYGDSNVPNEAEDISNYAVGLMLGEQYLRPNVIQVINDAKSLDFSKLNELDATKLVKLSKEDITYLKSYMITIFNVYGLTNYTFKLLEYLYLIEGTPKTEVQSMLKFIANDGVTKNLNGNELEQLKRHLLRIYDDYNESLYILEFLQIILETRFRPSDNVNKNNIGIDYGDDDIQNEEQEMIEFVLKIMISENNISSDVIKVLNSAKNIDLSNIDKLNEMRLDHVTKEDVIRLKRYLIQVVNLYGLTAYTFKLLEYIYILEGRPKIESYLMWLVLTDNAAVTKFNNEELKLIHEHLRNIYEDYSESPYILALLKNILDNQLKINDKDRTIERVNDVIKDTPKTDMQKINVHLSQTYNDNHNVLKILKSVNDINEFAESDIKLPVVDQTDLQGLTALKPDDLDLLVKYILQVISRRGDNIYFNGLLSYIYWIQNIKNNTVTNRDNFNTTEEKVDLSPIYQYLLEFNSPESNKIILILLNQLSQRRVTTMHYVENLGYGDLITVKEFLLHNKSVELSPAVLDFRNKLNQAILKQEAEVISKGDQLVEVVPDDLEVLKQYMMSKKTAAPDYYLDEILQIIEQAQNRIDENGFGKLKYFDLMQIYKYLLQTQGGVIDSPVLVNVRQYVNENNHNMNVKKDSSYKKPADDNLRTNDVFNDNQISLEEMYKLLLNRSVTDKTNPLLLKLLKYFNETQVMANGEHKIKILSVNDTKPGEQISQSDLENLLPYLINGTENSETERNNYLYADLLKYLMNEIPEKDYNMIRNPLYVIPIDALYRIKLYLQTFVKVNDENEHVSQIILRINDVLKSQPDNIKNKIINDLNVNESDLKFLLEYLTKYVNVTNPNSDFIKIIKYIIKSENDIKNQTEYEKNQEHVRLLLMKLIDSDISIPVKNILQFLLNNKNEDDPYLVITKLKDSHMLENLNKDDIQELLKYLLEIKTTLGPNEPLGILIDYILRVQKEKNEFINEPDTTSTDKPVPEMMKKNTENHKIPGKSVKIINEYLIYLYDLYHKDEDVARIMYKINHIKDGSNINKDLILSMISSNNNDMVISADDLSSISGYIINLINHYGINQDLMEMFRVIFNFDWPPIDTKVSIVDANDAQIRVAVEKKNLEEIGRYIDSIAKNFKLYPHQLNVLPVLYTEQNNSSSNNTGPNSIHTIVIKHGQLSLLTKYLLELIQQYGAHPELINVLIFVCDIYIDKKMTIKEHIDQPHVLVISDEMRALHKAGVIQEIQNISKDSLKNLYSQLVQKLFESLNYDEITNKTQIINALVDIYKTEETPINKYIVLKLFDCLKNNKEVNYEALWQPEFVLKLLDITKDPFPPNNVNQTNIDRLINHSMIAPYNYKNDIQGSLSELINKMYPPVKTNDNNTSVGNFTINENANDDVINRPTLSIVNTKNQEHIDGKEEKKIVTGNNTIFTIINGEIFRKAKPNITVERIHKLSDKTNETNKNHEGNYGVYETSEDWIRVQILPSIDTEKILQPIDIKGKNESIAGYKIEENSNHRIDENGFHRPTEHIKVIKVLKPIETTEKNRNIVVNYTVYAISNDGINRSTSINPMDTIENNKNILVNHSIYENKIVDGIPGKTQSNINEEKSNEPIETKKHNKNNISNETIFIVSSDGIHKQTESKIKIVKVLKPINANKINTNSVANYTINGIEPYIKPVNVKAEKKYILVNHTRYPNTIDDIISGQNVNIEKYRNRINTKENNKNIIGKNTIYVVGNNRIHGQTQPDINVGNTEKSFDTTTKNDKNVVSDTVYKINNDNIQDHTTPNIKAEINEGNQGIVVEGKITLPKNNVKKILNLTEIHHPKHNIVVKYEIHGINDNQNQRRTDPNVKPSNANESISNNTIHMNIIKNDTRDPIQSNINADNTHESIDTKENNENITGNNTIKVENINDPIDINGENKNVLNTTIYDINKDRNSDQTPPNLKEMSCEQASNTLNLILNQLRKASSSNKQRIGLSLNEFIETYAILQKFKSKLTSESPDGEVSSKILMKELEQRLLANNIDACQYQPNMIVKTIISNLVKVLRRIIQYMRVRDYDDDRMKKIVGSLVNHLLPEINAMAVKDCEVQTPKGLMSILFSKIYSNKDLEEDEVEFENGYTPKGNSYEDFLHTSSMQKLLQEIDKYRKLL